MQAPGENLILRMWETLAEKGIGTLLRPWQMRREARASIEIRQQELLLLAQAEIDAAAIRAGQRRLGPGGELVPVQPESTSSAAHNGEDESKRLMLKAVTDSAIADATRREVNVAKAILFAEEDIQQTSSTTQGGQEVPDATADPDWLYRWRDAASEVSAEELQHLWGRVLAGEVRSPGSFSLRTLEFLRNISRQEAEAIELLSRYALGAFIYSGESGLLEAEGMNLSFLLGMQDLGLISGVGGLGFNITLTSLRPESFELAFRVANRILVVTHPDPQKKLELAAYVVTRLGNEVLSLGAPKPSDPYLRSLGTAIVGKGFKVIIASGFMLPDGQFHYSNAEQIQGAPPPA